MFVAKLRLINFRSYRDTSVAFAPGLNVIVGPNASGKTNLLEGAFFALRAASCRTNREEKAVRWGASFARTEAGLAGSDGRRREIAVAYAPGQGKRVLVEGVEAATSDELRRQGHVFVFVPESLLLIKGSPARRRAHLDAFAAALDSRYEAAWRELQGVLRQRNAQLARVREGGAAAALEPWDRQLARVGLELERRRRGLVADLCGRFAGYAGRLAPHGGDYVLELVSQLDTIDDEEGFLAALDRRRPGEIRRSLSAFGPHRDDVRFVERFDPSAGGSSATEAAAAAAAAPQPAAADDTSRYSRSGGAQPGVAPSEGDHPGGARPEDALRDLRLFGSQGEQRAAVLALLLAERALAEERTGDLGTLLLDDVMSELDDERRRLLVRALASGGQAIITTTNRLYFTEEELAGVNLIELPLTGAATLAATGAPPSSAARLTTDQSGHD